MLNMTNLGGYPVVGNPVNGQWLWFTGQKWVPKGLGIRGQYETYIPAPLPVFPFISNQFLVEFQDLQAGDVLGYLKFTYEFAPGETKEIEMLSNLRSDDLLSNSRVMAVPVLLNQVMVNNPTVLTILDKPTTSFDTVIS
ncbi:MAG: hypothetical protein K9L62_06330 [Vallitaleaceae bacterium]|nr:hypothetical protein [Vallitaleaceae bacterium]